MKKTIISLFLLISFCAIINAQDASGTIYYENGKTLKFFNIKEMRIVIEDFTEPTFDSLVARYQGKDRLIPFYKLKELKIIKFGFVPGAPTMLWEAKAEITTKTGDTFTSDYQALLLVKITIFDELTGENTDQDVTFGELGKLNIRKIVFD